MALKTSFNMAGYTGALLILLLTPLLWAVPTAMMVGELASAIPEEGGFYIWVTRGLGKFWGFQEVWLSMAGSIFEMALYPTLFVDYLGHFAPRAHRRISWPAHRTRHDRSLHRVEYSRRPLGREQLNRNVRFAARSIRGFDNPRTAAQILRPCGSCLPPRSR